MDSRPCQGDAWESTPYMMAMPWQSCVNCTSWFGNRHVMWPLHTPCPGPDGYAFFLPVALEVAGERKTGPSATGGTVTDITLYPAGTDPRLGLEDVTEWWEFP